MVTGTVFCDQCKDGQRSIFDYPLSGATVAVECGSGGAVLKEDTTNWLGFYTVRVDGSQDLSACTARVVAAPSSCGAAAGPPRPLALMFRMLGMALYAAEEPLLSEPREPVGFCPPGAGGGGGGGGRGRSGGAPPSSFRPPPPSPAAVPVVPSPPPPLASPPAAPVSRPPPARQVEASACSYDKWITPDYMCYWKVVSPGTSVALAFGPVAAARYGMDMTLWQGLQGRGDVYRTLLREATTSLLNSYNSLGFFYPTLSVIELTNLALLGSPQQALMTALRFRRANAGVAGRGTNATCNFTPCS
ncbi:hypothetical protein ACMD2_18636 [Ananas comosus]|uniref:Uncharacterized protein n=1 Tax=Ananas comosus TaxID=4615 RepID=A0A199UP24_ANACO|nr:hypothetical protein ACMD2_18636 [Ananas comosus]